MRTKADMQAELERMLRPLIPFYSPGCASLRLGSSNSYCGLEIGGMEAFSRVLWGLVPLLAGGGESIDNRVLREKVLRGIRSGTNPQHDEYWGDVTGTDQRLVEMAVFGMALALAPEHFWEPLSPEEQQQLYRWLNQINVAEPAKNNWQFFRILVNLGLHTVGLSYDQTKQQESLDFIETMYVRDGWYSDDNRAFQRDYYISFGFHFYGLVYSKLMKEQDPKRSALYVQRARVFSHDFIYWFAEDGSAVPYGRSMTYRFAQVSFWCAMVYAGVDDDYDWGVMKGLVMRHLRWWLERDIFTPEGLLSIGYTYANLNMAEGYNGPGSPYWALKTFLVLALPDEHPFWKAEEKPLPKLEERSVQKQAGMILCHDLQHQHVFALTAGQLSYSEHAHNEAKYAKFAYSNRFGFSVPKGAYSLSHGAFDSMLALSEQDGYYRGRRSCEEVTWEGDVLYSRWKPWQDVRIDTWLIPVNGEWHVRLHRIETARVLSTAEGGFAIPDSREHFSANHGVALACSWGISAIYNLYGDRQAESIRTEPNTNLIHSGCNEIPTLRSELDPGTHWYAAAVFASVEGERSEEQLKQRPTITRNDDVWRVYFSSKVIAGIHCAW